MRPLHPPLPDEWISRALRVAMPESDWAQFQALVATWAGTAPTQARAHGMALSRLLHAAPPPNTDAGPLDWLDWEHRKTLRLLLQTGS